MNRKDEWTKSDSFADVVGLQLEIDNWINRKDEWTKSDSFTDVVGSLLDKCWRFSCFLKISDFWTHTQKHHYHFSSRVRPLMLKDNQTCRKGRTISRTRRHPTPRYTSTLTLLTDFLPFQDVATLLKLSGNWLHGQNIVIRCNLKGALGYLDLF